MVHTSNTPGAGTGGGVWVELEGLVGVSGPQDLPSDPLAFDRGQVSVHVRHECRVSGLVQTYQNFSNLPFRSAEIMVSVNLVKHHCKTPTDSAALLIAWRLDV